MDIGYEETDLWSHDEAIELGQETKKSEILHTVIKKAAGLYTQHDYKSI